MSAYNYPIGVSCAIYLAIRAFDFLGCFLVLCLHWLIWLQIKVESSFIVNSSWWRFDCFGVYRSNPGLLLLLPHQSIIPPPPSVFIFLINFSSLWTGYDWTREAKLEVLSLPSIIDCSAGFLPCHWEGQIILITVTKLQPPIWKEHIWVIHLCAKGCTSCKLAGMFIHCHVKMDVGSLDWQGERWEGLGTKCSSCWAVVSCLYSWHQGGS